MCSLVRSDEDDTGADDAGAASLFNTSDGSSEPSSTMLFKTKESEKGFQGHLFIACTGDDSDLEIVEKITL
jgi:hypothetical protein